MIKANFKYFGFLIKILNEHLWLKQNLAKDVDTYVGTNSYTFHKQQSLKFEIILDQEGQ